MKLTDVIRRPLITEKTTIQREDGRTLVFEVAAGATKVEIKQASSSCSARRSRASARRSRTAR
jgi:ribosomal protein L23